MFQGTSHPREGALGAWLDGGGPPDDGLFTLSGPREQVAMVIVYEDTDGARKLTPRSVVRYVGGRLAQ